MSGLVNGLQNRLQQFESARHLLRVLKRFSVQDSFFMSKLCAGRIHTKRSPSLGELGLRELRRQDSRSAQRDASLAKNVDLGAREDAAVEDEKKPETGFVSCGGRIRTCDLQVMSLASYQLLHSAMFLILRVQRYK